MGGGSAEPPPMFFLSHGPRASLPPFDLRRGALLTIAGMLLST